MDRYTLLPLLRSDGSRHQKPPPNFDKKGDALLNTTFFARGHDMSVREHLFSEVEAVKSVQRKDWLGADLPTPRDYAGIASPWVVPPNPKTGTHSRMP